MLGFSEGNLHFYKNITDQKHFILGLLEIDINFRTISFLNGKNKFISTRDGVVWISEVHFTFYGAQLLCLQRFNKSF